MQSLQSTANFIELTSNVFEKPVSVTSAILCIIRHMYSVEILSLLELTIITIESTWNYLFTRNIKKNGFP